MEPRHELDNLRAAQHRQRSTLRRAIQGPLGEPHRLSDKVLNDVTEWDLRLAAQAALSGYHQLIADLEVAQAKEAARRLFSSGALKAPTWDLAAASSIAERFAKAASEGYLPTDGSEHRDRTKTLRDAVALLEAADLLAGQG